MKHQMRLDPQPFELIRSGRKTIELRLFDEKRQKIAVGDVIVFSCREKPDETVPARVIALHRFDSFASLYASLPLLKCGYTEETLADARPEDMDCYYTREDQAKYGVVGIELRRVRSDEDRLNRISRFLALVLRHKPQAAGITLDAHGWAEVPALLRGVSGTYPLTRTELEEIVRTDEKQRYSFSEDRTKIRANQGHSVPVDVELERCAPPDTLYHGTGRQFRDSILSQGLMPKGRLYVHLSGDRETAKAVGLRHGTPVVFSVSSGQMARDGVDFYRSANGVWLTRYVAPCYLRES